jgi:propionate CoA-transferase
MGKIYELSEAIDLIKSTDTIGLSACGGGLVEPDFILKGLEKKFLETGKPENLSVIHTSGLGDRKEKGMSRFAHEGMVKRVIGAHWLWSPKLCQMAMDDKIEAYILPQGVISRLYREIASGGPGLITHIGIGTFVDPDLGGGKINKVTTEELVEKIEIHSKTYLLYKTMPINVAIIRGSVADEDGNVSFEDEPVIMDVLALAQAAKNSGGKVICQVKRLTTKGSLNPWNVIIPAILTDAVVVDPEQIQTYEGEYNPYFTGRFKALPEAIPPMPLSERKIISRRAAMELKKGMTVNLGFGMPDGVSAILAEENCDQDVNLTMEMGVIGGIPAQGAIFGAATNPVAIISQTSQFDFYAGGGLDIAFLGFGQVDQKGNVNVSKVFQYYSGVGGFIDISQGTDKVIFCGTFTVRGLDVGVSKGKQLEIRHEGAIKKIVNKVDHVSFNGDIALKSNKEVYYVTERAVFKLMQDGLTLIEIAPGVDLERDILSNMEFRPKIAKDLKIMDERIFEDKRMGLQCSEF